MPVANEHMFPIIRVSSGGKKVVSHDGGKTVVGSANGSLPLRKG